MEEETQEALDAIAEEASAEDMTGEATGEEMAVEPNTSEPEGATITMTENPSEEEVIVEEVEEPETTAETTVVEEETEKKETVVNSRSCPGFTFPSPFINKAAIYADDERIYGMRFLSVEGPADFGSLSKGIPILETFEPTEQLIGFYGSYNGDIITSLGFLTNDPTCIPIPDPEPEVEVEIIEIILKEVTMEDGDGGLGIGMILGIVFGVLALIGLGVGGFFLWRRRKRQNMNKVYVMPDAADASSAKIPDSYANIAPRSKINNLLKESEL